MSKSAMIYSQTGSCVCIYNSYQSEQASRRRNGKDKRQHLICEFVMSKISRLWAPVERPEGSVDLAYCFSGGLVPRIQPVTSHHSKASLKAQSAVFSALVANFCRSFRPPHESRGSKLAVMSGTGQGCLSLLRPSSTILVTLITLLPVRRHNQILMRRRRLQRCAWHVSLY